MMNPMTNAQERLFKILTATDGIFKKMGEVPYGMRKTTPAEQRQAYANLTPNELMVQIERHGVKDVNEWLSREKK